MNAPHGPIARPISGDLQENSPDLTLWWRAVALRSEWLDHALSTEPADHPAVEHAVTRLYALIGHSPPEFVWTDSPAAAAKTLPPTTPHLSLRSSWPLESRLASRLSALRQRLDRSIGIDLCHHAFREPEHPEAAIRSGGDLRGALYSGLRRTLERSVRDRVATPIRTAAGQRGLFWYGQHEANWVAYYEIHRRLGTRFSREDLAELEIWTALVRHGGWWWPREDVCVLSERPAELHVESLGPRENAEIRLHHETGPAVRYPDGWTVHSWHGTRVPAWVIEDPDPARIGAETNAEIRRCAIERLGWTTYLDGAHLTLVGRAADPGNPGHELRLYDLPRHDSGRGIRLLLAVNGSVERDGTRRRYGLHVPRWFDDPVDAAAWTYGLTGAQYARLRRRT